MIAPLIMISVGVVFMILELLFMNFVLIFFGLGFLIVGAVNFGVKFGWEWQILLSFLLSLVLLFTLKKPLKRLFSKNSKSFNNEFLDESGVGEVKDGMVYYKGTFWKSDEIKELKDGDKVEISGIKNSGGR